MKKILIVFAALLCAAGAWAQAPCKNPQKDDTNLLFLDDPRVPGQWRAVDFVKNINDFDPRDMHFKGDLYLKDITFYFNGSTSLAFNWTNGYVLHYANSTAARYIIKEDCKNNHCESYMFMEWKSGDYICKNLPPKYYVLKKITSAKTDDTDMPFVNDKNVLGRWKSVDFVSAPSAFNPNNRHWKDELFLHDLVFMQDGKMKPPFYSWTKGFVLKNGAEKTASAYETKKIDGKEYLFLQWKSGDYVYRGQTPKYYVLEKQPSGLK